MRQAFCHRRKSGAKAEGRLPAWSGKGPWLGLLAPWFLASILAAPDSARALEAVASATIALAGGKLYALSLAQDADCVLQGTFADPAPSASEIAGAPFNFPHPPHLSSPNSLEYGLFLGGTPAETRTLLLSHSQPRDKNLNLSLYDAGSAGCQTSLPQLIAGAARGDLSAALETRVLLGDRGPRRVDGLVLDRRFYFHDPSRRSVFSSGAMAPTAALETLIFRQVFTEDESLHFLRADAAATPSAALISDAVLRSAVDAQANLAMVYDLMLQKGLNGYDGRGGGVFALVDYRPPGSGCDSPIALSIGNALLFSPPGRYRLPRIPPLICSSADYDNSYASLLDVVAHEYAHVVTRAHIDLLYQGESGALDEAFADWTGVAVELAAGGGLDWQIGEGLRGGPAASPAGGQVSPLRDLQDPNRFGHPARIGGAHWQNPNEKQCDSSNDYCYVHSNNGVPNHMFYRLATGLAVSATIAKGGLDAQGEDVDLILAPFDGLGVARAFALSLYAATNLWQRQETFAQAADHMRLAAMALHGAQACEIEVVARSWAYVGVQLGPEEAASAGGRLSCPVGGESRRGSLLGVWGPSSLESILWLFFVLAASRRMTAAGCIMQL